MNWSVRVATLFGIPIRVHATFLLLLAAGAWLWRGESFLDSLIGVGLVGVVFLCILLHELGHCLMARRYGVVVESITLLPIGGMAAMRSLPHSPGAEFLIALAGPAVSFGLAGGLAGLAYVLHGPQIFSLALDHHEAAPILLLLATLNLFLGGFNLVPAFPLDGGRLLRAGLWSRIGFEKATRLATRVGQVIAIILFVLAVLSSRFVLMIIAVFVYFGAQAESRAAGFKAVLANVPAFRVMLTNFVRARADQPASVLRNLMIQAGQDVLPVYDDHTLLGLISYDRLRSLDRSQTPEPLAAQLLDRNVVFCSPIDSLASVLEAMTAQDLACIAVIDNDQLVGLITPRQIGRVGVSNS
ncbi:MAG: CBS domain-containing protein [Phycisphaerae bacterium]|nr:CBS domain-containing protein [Phycisphaerae bacterium]